jgi:filamentous hemagglutinin
MNWRVDRARILDYLLNPFHPAGAAKARFFLAAGFSRARWVLFRDALSRHPLTASLDTVDPTRQYGEKRTYRCRLDSPTGRNPCILTVWQQSGEDFRLVTAYPFQQ